MRKEKYGENYETHLLEQYKIYVEMTDRISARRNQTNSFYISLLSGLLALLSLTGNQELFIFKNNRFQFIGFLAVAILGISLCILWFINIGSYKQLNSGKFKIIHEMEEYLPFPCYSKEWDILKGSSKVYLQLTWVEKYIPIVLIIPYFLLFAYSTYGLVK